MRIIDAFEKEIQCDYRGEHYSVRDNGSVMRHLKEGKKPRPLDGIWTFGTIDNQKGYTKIGNEAVHRIVATAFLGDPPTPNHVVDHIDTNRQNNRPENLRWVTKLENAVLNEITRKKLEWICGCSIDEIVDNWSIIQNKKLPPNIAWMKTVTEEEAKESLLTLKKYVENLAHRKEADNITIQYFRYRRGPTAMVYPLEPIGGELSLKEYENNLIIGKTFCYRDYKSERYGYRILSYYYNQETKVLSVATYGGNGTKSLFITTIKIDNNDFVYSTRSFFTQEGLEKYMTLAKGEEWTGGTVIDDYC